MAEPTKLKKKIFKPNHASTIYLQVIGSGAPGAPKSLFLFTDHCRYLFNCGEGTQRLASEHKIKLSMTEHILITHKSWENVGGLLGTLLTLQDAGVSAITVHGPSHLETFYNDTKGFSLFNNLKVTYKEYKSNEKVIEEGPIEIETVSLIISSNAENFNEQKLENQEYDGIDKKLALSYICRASPKPGALLPERCREFGVPLGPLMGELKKGNDVTLPNGNTVKAKDVTEPPSSGVIFIIVDITEKSFLPLLTTTEAFFKHQRLKGCRDEDVAEVVVHFSPLEVVEEAKYQEWIRDFGTSTSHIYINEKNSCMGSESVHKIQYKLNHLYPPSFPKLKDIRLIVNNNENEEPTSLFKRRKVEPKEQNGVECYTLNNMKDEFLSFTCLTYHIRPLNRFDMSKRIEINPSEYIKECYSVEDFSTSYYEAIKKVEESKLTFSTHLKGKFPYFLFLGTGSCIPNKTRNTSGIAFFINSESTMLLDCGEGTYGQLVRHLGTASTAKFLHCLSVIFISHKHADHHIGLIRILLARKKVFQNAGTKVSKLVLLAPKNILYYLISYNKYFEPISDTFTFVSNELFIKEKYSPEVDEKIKILKNFGIESFETCFVHHCSFSYGMSVTVENDFKITYSGDTMPCQSLVKIGVNCDILIHEATMEDDLKEDAKAKKHSTTSEAIDIGNQMNAKYIILTHFSQRYAKVPLLDVVPENVIIAFDNMVVHLSDLPCLSHLYPTYKLIFSEDIEEILKKKAKRNNEIK